VEQSRTCPNNLSLDLQTAIAGLETVNPWAGLWRFSLLGGLVLTFVGLAWSSHNLLLFVGYTAIAGVFYAFWLICTHDAVHHTLTGWVWFDELMPRLISYPMLWTYGAYSQLHRLHHGWNGINLSDPERVQWTVAEYQQASPWMQWYVRHQWFVDLFWLSGFGLIVKTIANAVRFRHQVPVLPRLLLLDGVGIILVQCVLVTIAASEHRLGDYLLFWLLLERTIGIIAQARDHLEHYALWGKADTHQLTQIYASRNLKTSLLVGWLMGALNYHAIHHAFPTIPFNHLPEAFSRIQRVLEQQHQPPMVVDRGYVQETFWLGIKPLLIGEPDPNELTGRHQMFALP
jgi:fatty acid desaturase